MQGANDRQLAISPDGTRLAYVSSTGLTAGTLMIRALDRLEAEPLRGITDARTPFFSPDGRWIGFFGGGDLKKVSTTGGPPITLCQIEGAPRGASWGSDDTVVFATQNTATGLMSVAAGGGEPIVLTKPDATQGETDHLFPSVLPSGRAVLFTITTRGGSDNAQVAVLDLETGQQKTLIRGGGNAEYVETGHLVYTAAGTLFAVRFDPVRLEVLSDPVPIVEEVAMAQVTGSAAYSVSRTGTLVYMPVGPGGAAATRSLVWVSRQGREEPVKTPPRAYFALRLSPDGTRVALDIRDQEYDTWIWDLPRQTLTRLTFNPGNDPFPVWTPDGRRVVFGRPDGLFWRLADGTGTDERLTTAPYTQFPMSFSPDGKSLVVTELKASNDLSLLPMDGKGQIAPLVQTMFTEGLGEISPDGQRFLMIKDLPATDQASTATPASIVVVLNWHEELKRLVPTR